MREITVTFEIDDEEPAVALEAIAEFLDDAPYVWKTPGYPAYQHIVVIIETDSDVPGVEHAYGPFSDSVEAGQERSRLRNLQADDDNPDLIQTVLLSPPGSAS